MLLQTRQCVCFKISSWRLLCLKSSCSQTQALSRRKWRRQAEARTKLELQATLETQTRGTWKVESLRGQFERFFSRLATMKATALLLLLVASMAMAATTHHIPPIGEGPVLFVEGVLIDLSTTQLLTPWQSSRASLISVKTTPSITF